MSIPKKFISVGSVDVSSCMDCFIAPETMEKCGYKCEKCKAVDRMEKDITIFRFPTVLVIHLKRFSRREKITTSVSIPSKLDMTKYAPYSGKYKSFSSLLLF